MGPFARCFGMRRGGDAKRMAKDVEGAWVEIAAHGARTTDEAIAFVANLKKSGRYQQDVY